MWLLILAGECDHITFPREKDEIFTASVFRPKSAYDLNHTSFSLVDLFPCGWYAVYDMCDTIIHACVFLTAKRGCTLCGKNGFCCSRLSRMELFAKSWNKHILDCFSYIYYYYYCKYISANIFYEKYRNITLRLHFLTKIISNYDSRLKNIFPYFVKNI